MPPLFHRIPFLIFCALIATGCPSGAELEGAQNWGPDTGKSCDPTPIFEAECAGGACHGSPKMMTPLGGIDLLAPGLEERLIDQPATYPTLNDPNCNKESPELLVSTTEPARSLLLTKLNGEHDCGAAMPIPRQANYLDAADIECISNYINTIIASSVPGDSSTTETEGNGGSPAANDSADESKAKE